MRVERTLHGGDWLPTAATLAGEISVARGLLGWSLTGAGKQAVTA